MRSTVRHRRNRINAEHSCTIEVSRGVVSVACIGRFRRSVLHHPAICRNRPQVYSMHLQRLQQALTCGDARCRTCLALR